jgi:hypothetical protein
MTFHVVIVVFALVLSGVVASKVRGERYIKSFVKDTTDRVLRRPATAAQPHQNKEHGLRGSTSNKAFHKQKLATSTHYLTMNIYSDTSCSSLYIGGTYNLDICVPLLNSTDGTLSTAFVFSESVLYKTFYSDNSCATTVTSQPLLDLSGVSQESCFSEYVYGAKYSLSASYSVPSTEGVRYEYVFVQSFDTT